MSGVGHQAAPLRGKPNKLSLPFFARCARLKGRWVWFVFCFACLALPSFNRYIRELNGGAAAGKQTNQLLFFLFIKLKVDEEKRKLVCFLELSLLGSQLVFSLIKEKKAIPSTLLFNKWFVDEKKNCGINERDELVGCLLLEWFVGYGRAPPLLQRRDWLHWFH